MILIHNRFRTVNDVRNVTIVVRPLLLEVLTISPHAAV